jgi:hypothetical protein
MPVERGEVDSGHAWRAFRDTNGSQPVEFLIQIENIVPLIFGALAIRNWRNHSLVRREK